MLPAKSVVERVLPVLRKACLAAPIMFGIGDVQFSRESRFWPTDIASTRCAETGGASYLTPCLGLFVQAMALLVAVIGSYTCWLAGASRRTSTV